MWDSNGYRSAHARLKEQHPRHLWGAVALALALVGLGAIVSPPYVPRPYIAPLVEITPLLPPPQYAVPVVPKAPPRPQIPVEIDPFDGPGPEDPLPIQPDDPLRIVVPAVLALPSQAPIQFVRKPKVVYAVAPEYPEIAQAVEAEGTVAVQVTVDANGRVAAARILSSDTIEALELAALEAARGFLFTPCMQTDVAVPCQVVLRFSFVLD